MARRQTMEHGAARASWATSRRASSATRPSSRATCVGTSEAGVPVAGSTPLRDFFAAGFLTAGFLALAAGFLAAGFRLAAAMADVSPVPSEGAGALAVDSRPLRRAHAPGTCRAHASTAPGSPRPTGAQTQRTQQLARRPGARAGRRAKKRQRRARRIAELAWGSSARDLRQLRRGPTVCIRSTHVQIASWVTALLRLCAIIFLAFSVASISATALRLLEQVQGNLDAVRAVYG